MEGRRRKLALVETRERQAREKALRREQRLEQEARLERERTAVQAGSMDSFAMQDLYVPARDHGLWESRKFNEGELCEGLNDAAEYVEGADESGDEDESYAPDWKASAEEDGDDDGPKHRRKRKKGYGTAGMIDHSA